MISKEFFMLGRIIKMFISSNLQRRPRIIKEFFMLGRKIKILITSILQRRPSILLGRKKRDIFLL